MKPASDRFVYLRVVTVAAVIALVGAACGSSGKSAGKASTGATTAPPNVPNGGTLVIGAEQEPDCADWIDNCAGASWGTWTMEAHTMPRAFEMVNQNGDWVYKPSNLLQGEPTLSAGPPRSSPSRAPTVVGRACSAASTASSRLTSCRAKTATPR